MSVGEKFNLEKSKATLDRFILSKGLNTAPTLRVGVAVDVSYSMAAAFRSGAVQDALNKLVPVGLKFDDNGEIDVFQFDDSCDHVGTMDAKNYSDFVRNNRMGPRGGTSYAPIVRKARDYFFGEGGKTVSPVKSVGFLGKLLGGGKPAPVTAPQAADTTPALVLILTDGDCGDAAAAERELVAAQKDNVYWLFVGVGSASFHTIKRLADKLPNVGDVYVRDFDVSDEELYQQVVGDELIQWVRSV